MDLVPTATITCSGTYTVTETDVTNLKVTNVASARGSFNGMPVDSATDTVTVNAPPLKAAGLLDPFCVFENNEYRMQWAIDNQNKRVFPVSDFTVDGAPFSGFVAPVGLSNFTQTTLGTHTVTVNFIDPLGAPSYVNLTYTIDSCTGYVPPVNPPRQNVAPLAVVAPLPIPATGGASEILIPVTGGDFTKGTGGFFFAGIGLLGFGLVMTGLRKKFNI
jgi:hypothetical protein